MHPSSGEPDPSDLGLWWLDSATRCVITANMVLVLRIPLLGKVETQKTAKTGRIGELPFRWLKGLGPAPRGSPRRLGMHPSSGAPDPSDMCLWRLDSATCCVITANMDLCGNSLKRAVQAIATSLVEGVGSRFQRRNLPVQVAPKLGCALPGGRWPLAVGPSYPLGDC